MSREDVEVVKSWLDSYNAGERDRIDDLFAEDGFFFDDARALEAVGLREQAQAHNERM